MTPQLQLAIKLLTLTNLELEAYIGEEIERNPLLSSDDSSESGSDTSLGDSSPAAVDPVTGGLDQLLGTPTSGTDAPLDVDYTGEAFNHDSGSDLSDWGAAASSGEGADNDFEHVAQSEASLVDVLGSQASAALAGDDLVIARHLIDLLDDAGYLTESLDSVADRLGVETARVEAVLAVIQRVEPTGVGARSLGECLALQAREVDRLDPAMAMLLDHLDLVARNDFAGLMRLCKVDREDVADMIRELRRYDPKPGLRYGGERASPVVADVFVSRSKDGEWRIELNAATLPRLIIDRDYQALLERGSDKATTSFVGDCVVSANWLMKALDQRARTIVRVASELVKQQRGFFEQGISELRPLTLRSIAEEVEMHESTISRVTSNKYLQCERGLFEMKYFFTSGIHSNDGGQASSALSVKDRIERLIAAESLETLSDDQLVTILRSEGFDIARRTVAKYREALGVPSSYDRRRARLVAAA